jgi:hypothetical protein
MEKEKKKRPRQHGNEQKLTEECLVMRRARRKKTSSGDAYPVNSRSDKLTQSNFQTRPIDQSRSLAASFLCMRILSI